MKTIFISWAPHCSRSDNIARELGGSSHMVYWQRLGSHPLTVWLKYLGQWGETWRILQAERPEAVLVMVPPVFAALCVATYCAWSGARFVLDAHTAAFLHPRWKHLQWLQRAVSRRAAATLVTNTHLADVVRAGGAHAIIVRDVPVVFPRMEAIPLSSGFNVAVVCSFNPDEPLEEIVQAAGRLPDVSFYLTGDASRFERQRRSPVPPNVTLTGFLSEAQYGGLLDRAHVVMTLTTRDHTMLRGAYEAVYQGTPVIVSDWPILRQAFDRGVVHVDNSTNEIVRAIREVQQTRERLKEEVSELRRRKLADWQQVRHTLLAELAVAGDPRRKGHR